MSDFTHLSKQEKRILGALSTGSLYKEIASEYSISINTVKKHIKNIYKKLQVSKRSQAAQKFNENQPPMAMA
jgi:DNA-binding NarL/FixJ family response regulator